MKAAGRLLLVLLVAAGVVTMVAIGVTWRARHGIGDDPEEVARASLHALRRQGRLTPFAALFSAALAADRASCPAGVRIVPGLVRYSLDLSRLHDRDLRWMASGHVLQVALPPIELAGPDLDLEAAQRGNRIGQAPQACFRTQISGSELDAARTELSRQARAPGPMQLARDAARTAIESSFASSLMAAGMDVAVTARFADDR